jgi:F-type H+-transporting ATPase subunit b
MHKIDTSPLISFNWSFVMILITLLALYFILRKFFFGKVKNFMDERSNEIQKTYDAADLAMEETTQLRADYEKKMEDIKIEQAEIFRKAKQIADKRAAGIVSDAEKKAETIMSKAHRDAAHEKEKAVLSAQENVAALTYLAVEQILKQQLTDAQKKQYLKSIDIGQV